MTDPEPKPVRRRRAVELLLALMVLAQLIIANEIRFQGCFEQQMTAMALAAESGTDEVVDMECSRVPLL